MNIACLLTGKEMASCDARTSDVIGIPSLVLMERAALSVADSVDVFLRPKFQGRGCGRRPMILAAAGRGNNGADALAAGRILLDRGFDVRFCRLSGKISLESSFAVQEKILRSYGAAVQEFPDSFLSTLCENPAEDSGRADVPDVIIDGLFGTGLSRNLEGEAAECVDAINRCRDLYGTYVVAVDIPSGISSDDGSVMGCAVRCDETRTFAFYKRGHFMYPGTVYAGACHLAEIGITPRAFERTPAMFTLQDIKASDLVPERDQGGNKGTFGKILLVAGRRNMCGAAILAARACMSAGAGMVKIFTHEANRVIIQQSLPEALLDTFTDEDTPEAAAAKLEKSLEWADIAAAGPAMGTDAAARALLRKILVYVQKEKAGDCADSAGYIDAGTLAEKGTTGTVRGLVLDADALRLLAGDEDLRCLLAGRRTDIPCILTPHLAEFAALAGRSVAECIADRDSLVQEQADRLTCTIACKDARTLVTRPRQMKGCSFRRDREGTGQSDPLFRMYLNTTGNSGMAAAGSGDVLTGMAAAFLALDFGEKEFCPSTPHRTFPEGGSKRLFTENECESGFAAAVTAVCLHGIAGDLAAREYGEQGMTANDLTAELRKASFWQE